MFLKRCLTILLLLLSSLPHLAAADVVSQLLERADTWLSRDRTDLARNAIDKLFSVSPENPDGIAALADIEIQEGRYQEAVNTAQRLARAQPDHPQLKRIQTALRVYGEDQEKLQQAQLMAKAGRTEEAIAALDVLYQGEPPTAQLAYQYWQLVSETPNGWQPALRGLTDLSIAHPGSDRYRLALIEHRLSRDPGNRQLLDELLSFVEKPRYEHQATASWRRAMMRLDEQPQSLPLYREYLEHDPKDHAVADLIKRVELAEAERIRRRNDPGYVALRKGEVLLDKGNVSGAAKELKKAKSLHPEDARVTGEIGRLKLRQGRHAEARALFEKALRKDPDNAAKWKSLRDTAQFWGLLAQAEKQMERGHRNAARKSLKQALQAQPGQPDALSDLAAWHASGGQPGKAEALYRKALRAEPTNSSALRGLSELYLDQGNLVAARSFFRSLTSSQRRSLGDNHARLEAALLRAEADRLLDDGKLNAAVSKLEQARDLRPHDAWLLYDLSRLYARQGNARAATQVFDNAVESAQDNSELRYAYALTLDSRDQPAAAITQLEAIPEDQRSDNMRETLRRLQVREGRRQALAAFQAGKPDQAASILEQMQTESQGEPLRLVEIAEGWSDIGQPRSALDLLEQVQQQSGSPADGEIDALRARIQLDLAGGYADEGDIPAAQRVLDEVPESAYSDMDLLSRRGSLYRKMEMPQQAVADYRTVYHQSDYSIDAGFDLLWAHIAAGNTGQATQLAGALGKRIEAQDVDKRIELVDAWWALDDGDQAEQALENLREDFPDNPEVLQQAAKTAHQQGDPDQALALYRSARTSYRQQAATPFGMKLPDLAELDREIELLALQRSGEFNMAYDLTSRDATPGKSDGSMQRIPIELRLPAAYNGHVFARVEPIKLDANSLPMNDRAEVAEFGQGLFCFPNCNGASADQKATGTALGLGYENDWLRVDIGTTPTNFPVSYMIGGIEVSGDVGNFYWFTDLSRRPVISSLLSFAGTEDIRTGNVWGGVRATGVRVGLGYDLGGDWGFWSSLGMHQLTGENVADNNRVRLMGGVYRRLIRREELNLSVGVNAGIWAHDKSLDEFTYGQGGYYSPNRYRSVSLPVDLFGRITDRWSYRLKGSVSNSWTYEERTPFYPNDRAIQAAAEAAIGTTGVDPYFDGSHGGGLGYSAEGAIEYKLNQNLAIGMQADIEVADYYEPHHFQLYLHYTFEKDPRKVRSPPRPMVPYTDF